MYPTAKLSKELLNTPLCGSTFDYSAVERNLAFNELAIKNGDKECKENILSTGTTIVASVYKDGVIVGADSRSTMGNIVANKNSLKLHRITDSIYAAGAGGAADLEKVTRMMEGELELFELNNEGKKARVMMAGRRLRQYLFQYQGHVKAYLLVCGVDATGAHLFEVSATGGGYLKPFSADGSGSLCAMAELESGFKPDMTEDECRKLVIKSLEAGMHGDDSSGNTYYIATFTKNGKKMEGPFTPTFCKRYELEGKYIFEPGTTTILKTKELQKEVDVCGTFVTPMET
ncbi:hypothetical protein ACQ4LE_007173 [Meloidogyne hapla]|uniref:proteasome endopeptidase complex n=1 Tax=Meloidogyne hapla TaxID=6305 RepID=A0A1I8BRJ8_MELHA